MKSSLRSLAAWPSMRWMPQAFKVKLYKRLPAFWLKIIWKVDNVKIIPQIIHRWKRNILLKNQVMHKVIHIIHNFLPHFSPYFMPVLFFWFLYTSHKIHFFEPFRQKKDWQSTVGSWLSTPMLYRVITFSHALNCRISFWF